MLSLCAVFLVVYVLLPDMILCVVVIVYMFVLLADIILCVVIVYMFVYWLFFCASLICFYRVAFFLI